MNLSTILVLLKKVSTVIQLNYIITVPNFRLFLSLYFLSIPFLIIFCVYKSLSINVLYVCVFVCVYIYVYIYIYTNIHVSFLLVFLC